MIGSVRTQLLLIAATGALAFACTTQTPDDESVADEAAADEAAALTVTNGDGDNADDDRPPHPPRPPQEAFDACKDLKAEDKCTVTFDDHKLEGVCREMREGDGLVCMPEHPKPPPEALDACKAKSAGDACSVTFGDRTMEGTCRELPDESDLVCAPKGMRPPHERREASLEEKLDRLEREIAVHE